MEKNFKVLKEELKQLAVELHSEKIDLKKNQREGAIVAACALQYSILKNRMDCRHKHIAYSMMKGRTYEQIEPKCKEDNKPNMDLVKRIIDEYSAQNVRACA